MKFRQTVVLGIIYDNCVSIRDVETSLDDSCADKYIVFIVRKVQDKLLNYFRFHLSVGKRNTGVWDELVYSCNAVWELRDFVVDIEDLSVARKFEVDCFLYYLIFVTMYLCLNRVAIGWRS